MNSKKVAVIVSADTEWKVTLLLRNPAETHNSPYGEWFEDSVKCGSGEVKIIVFHGGWGKISAAGSVQYVIDHFDPDLIVNLGTCGGFKDKINEGDIVAVRKAITYDIIEQIGDQQDSMDHYTSDIEVPEPGVLEENKISIEVILSADRDVVAEDVSILHEKYSAVVADWESSAIAYICIRNRKKLYILKGVSGLVSKKGGEVYGNLKEYEKRTHSIMSQLFDILPEII